MNAQQWLTVWEWFIAHKTPIGAFITSVSTAMIAGSPPTHARWWSIPLAVGAALTGAGVAPSDKHVQAKQEWEKEGFDRRKA